MQTARVNRQPLQQKRASLPIGPPCSASFSKSSWWQKSGAGWPSGLNPLDANIDVGYSQCTVIR
jgi:hypothetical protein